MCPTYFYALISYYKHPATMKRTLFFMLICIAALGFQACDDDDNKTATISKSELVGTWEYEDDYDGGTITFYSNNTGVDCIGWGYEAEYRPFTYKLTGQSIKIKFQDNSKTVTAQIKVINKTTIIMTSQVGTEMLYKID